MPMGPLALLLCLSAAADVPQPAPSSGTVVVTASLAPGTLAEVNREILVLDAETLRTLPVRTLGDALALAATVDLQPRVPGGLFGDIRMRGTHYAGVLVCIDGVRWNDPQTGHFNLEIPVPMDLVERIEVLTGSQCAFFGSEAVGGVINIITRRPDARAEARAEGGSYGTASAAGLLEGVSGAWSGRVFGGHTRSDGFTADRDFDMTQAVAEGDRETPQGRVRALYTFLDNRFGAQGFYGDYPSWEATTEHGFLLSASLDKGAFADHATRLDATWRRHDDNYVLYRDRPALYQNLHTDSTYQFKAVSVLFQGSRTTLTGATEASRDGISSARLGIHHVDRLAAALEALQELAPGLALQASLRGDRTSTWGSVWIPGAGLAWNASPRLKLRAAWGRAFRAPSFTELYYASPAQVGNPALQPERADSVEAGADWYGAGGALLSVTAFHRRDRDQIDWIRHDPKEPWTAANIGTVRVDGLSASTSLHPMARLRCNAGWTYTKLDIPAADYVSRYAPDCVRHQVTLATVVDLGRSAELSASCVHKQRALPGTDPLLLSVRLSRRFGACEGYLQGENLLDKRYEELAGVPMPGRTLAVGLRWSRLGR